MTVTFGQIVIWLIVGGFIGSMVGRLATRSREGYGRIVNTLLGVVGAIVGGGLFEIFGINLGLGQLKITFEDLIAALIGSVVVLVIVWGCADEEKEAVLDQHGRCRRPRHYPARTDVALNSGNKADPVFLQEGTEETKRQLILCCPGSLLFANR